MFDFSAQLKQRFAALQSSAQFFSLRYVKQISQHLSVRKNVAEPPQLSTDEGAMLTVRINGVEAYAATNDLSQRGLQAALEQAEGQDARPACPPRLARPRRGHQPRRLPVAQPDERIPLPERLLRTARQRIRLGAQGRAAGQLASQPGPGKRRADLPEQRRRRDSSGSALRLPGSERDRV
jgi:predicted Zn-dependent protease